MHYQPSYFANNDFLFKRAGIKTAENCVRTLCLTKCNLKLDPSINHKSNDAIHLSNKFTILLKNCIISKKYSDWHEEQLQETGPQGNITSPNFLVRRKDFLGEWLSCKGSVSFSLSPLFVGQPRPVSLGLAPTCSQRAWWSRLRSNRWQGLNTKLTSQISEMKIRSFKTNLRENHPRF